MTQNSTFSLARVRLALWALVVLAGIAVSVVYFLKPPTPAFGHPFALTSTEGGRFTDADLKGTPTLMYFGYTFCPDVCPTTLAALVGWREQLGLSPDKLRIVFVTVDPERDTLDKLKNYLSGFGTPIIGLHGTETETAQAKKAYGVVSSKSEGATPEDYLVNHTASVFVMDENGRFASSIDYKEAADTALAKIRRVTGS